MQSPIRTQAELMADYAPATAFAETFLREHPDMTPGEAGRQAYHAAHRLGLPALYVEAVVYDARKREIAETLRARREWAEENRAAFMGSV